MANPNLDLLVAMARAMGPLCEQVVFVSGCATGLLVDNATLMDVRPTEDVDAIVEVASLFAYHRLAEQLTARGFKQTMADNTPPFRWFWNRMQLDLVPVDEKVLGFANPWYRQGFEAAGRSSWQMDCCCAIDRPRTFWQPSSKPSKTVAKIMCTSAMTLKTS